MSNLTQEYERIYLMPPEEADPFDGRQWCEDNGNWDSPGVEFIRADLVEVIRAASYLAGRIAQAEEDAGIAECGIQRAFRDFHDRKKAEGAKEMACEITAAIRANVERLSAGNEGDAK